VVAVVMKNSAVFKRRKEAHVLTELPRDPSGKGLKPVLREQLDRDEGGA
jgi:acyl-coenzyme A synthetase/AMP-(fatty) acid ligase